MFGVLAALPLWISSALATAEVGAPTPLFRPVAPAAPAGCRDGLRAGGVRFTPWPLRPSRLGGDVVCEAPEGVAIRRGGAGLRFQPLARVNCAFAQRLERFQAIMQEEARNIFKSPVASIVHLGTYNCRRMAAYPDWVSEHSFANAIDIATFVLRNGRRAVPAAADPAPVRREGVLGRAHAVIRQPPQESPAPRRRPLQRRRHLSARNNDRGFALLAQAPRG
jgi:hypothetical protein